MNEEDEYRKNSIDSQQVHLKNSLALGFEYSLVEYKIESIFCCAYICLCGMDLFFFLHNCHI